MKKSEVRAMIKEEIQSLNEGKLKMPKNKEEAQDQAKDWQSDFGDKSHSWADVIEAGAHFEKVAKKFNLTKEFQENGII